MRAGRVKGAAPLDFLQMPPKTKSNLSSARIDGGGKRINRSSIHLFSPKKYINPSPIHLFPSSIYVFLRGK